MASLINATRESLPGAEETIVFSKCHVAKYLGEAVDKVGRQEHKALMAMRTLKAASMTGSATRRVCAQTGITVQGAT
uniref:transposase n=1 Tax=Candidatus Vondammii sp. HM_W22 TaxID=2687299 RepID=UPI002E7AFC07|nr:transposase [Candidatus Vondammii sp. HM_W22]